MKKLILTFVFVLIAAASSQAQNYQKDIVGIWKIDALTFIEANKMPVTEEQKPFVVPAIEKQFEKFAMVFSEGGIVTITTDDGTESSNYKIQGDSIILNKKSTKIIKLDKNNFVFMADDKYMALKKVQ